MYIFVNSLFVCPSQLSYAWFHFIFPWINELILRVNKNTRQNYVLCGNTCYHIFSFNLFICGIDSWNSSPWKTKNCQGHGWQHRYKQPLNKFLFAIGNFTSLSLSCLLHSTKRHIYYIQQHRVCITGLISPCKQDLVIAKHMSFVEFNITMAGLVVRYSIGPLAKWSNSLQTKFWCIFLVVVHQGTQSGQWLVTNALEWPKHLGYICIELNMKYSFGGMILWRSPIHFRKWHHMLIASVYNQKWGASQIMPYGRT